MISEKIECKKEQKRWGDVVDSIYSMFTTLYGFPQGKCGELAEKIQKAIGGELVAGYLVFNGFKREHWWVEKDKIIIDPMSDELQKTDPHRHEEVHRNIGEAYWDAAYVRRSVESD